MRILLCWITTFVIVCGLLAGAEPTSRPVTEAPKDETPLQMMKRGCKVYDTLDLDATMALTLTTNDTERAINKVYCRYAIALTRVEHLVEKKFGRPAADEVIHAAGEKTETDLDKAKVEMDGDEAKLFYEGEERPYYLRRVEGAWKCDLPRALKEQTAEEIKSNTESYEKQRVALDKLVKQIEDGSVATMEAITEAVTNITAPPPPAAPGKGGL